MIRAEDENDRSRVLIVRCSADCRGAYLSSRTVPGEPRLPHSRSTSYSPTSVGVTATT
jgi:hypothetical protein